MEHVLFSGDDPCTGLMCLQCLCSVLRGLDVSEEAVMLVQLRFSGRSDCRLRSSPPFLRFDSFNFKPLTTFLGSEVGSLFLLFSSPSCLSASGIITGSVFLSSFLGGGNLHTGRLLQASALLHAYLATAPALSS